MGSNLNSRHTTGSHVPPVHPAMNEYIPGVSWGANYGSFSFNSWTSGTHANYNEKVAGPPVRP